MDKISQQVSELKAEIIANRRLFHSHPESGFFTFFTSAKIASYLQNLGFKLKLGSEIMSAENRAGLGSKELCESAILRAEKLLNENEKEFLKFFKDGLTGVVAEIDTKRKGKTTAFRFDIDAVDVSESADLSHRPKAENFSSDIALIAHSCGHDGHIAIGLALAKLIVQNLDDFNGKFRFIFQTAEEGTRGAVAMAKSGILNEIDYLFGCHLGFMAKISRGIICKTDKFLATTKFDVILKGKASHAAAAPQDGNNALLAAAQIALNMHGITRNSLGITRINVGTLKAGSGRNVIADSAILACETRGETTELNDFMFENCQKIVRGVAEIYGVSFEIKLAGGTSGGDSDLEVAKIYEKCAINSPFIDNDKIEFQKDFGACEDFAHFMQIVQKNGGKSGYLMIGSDLCAGHHEANFDFDENSLIAGVDIFLRSAYETNYKEKK